MHHKFISSVFSLPRFAIHASLYTTMSALASYKFAVWAPDYTDDACLARRLSVREKHIEGAGKLKADGLLKVGAAMIQDGTHFTEQPKMQGSLLVYEAESIDVVWKLIKEDIYYTGGVWDKDRLQITPLKVNFGM